MLYLTAFITGLLGSFHCAGMCGPIAFALPTLEGNSFHYYLSRAIYNLGRILTYSIIGFLLGAFGSTLKIAGIQQGLSIGAGVMVLIWALLQIAGIKVKAFQPFHFLGKSWFGKLFRSKRYPSYLFIGVLNGLLPCGFVYIALLGSVVTQNAFEGAFFMVWFGLGTLPMMYLVSVIGQWLSQQVRSKLTRMVPYFAILIGALFLLRGLNLGIPFVSPKINHTEQQDPNCHS